MRTWDARLQHAANALAVGTGVLYAWTKYFAAPGDPYSRAASPWEPVFHNAHVLVVPLLIYACGMIWRSHILPNWNALRQRAGGQRPSKAFSGLALLLVMIPMIATGYLIQVSVDELWRKIWVIVHLSTSAVWSLSYAAHFLSPLLSRRESKLYGNPAPIPLRMGPIKDNEWRTNQDRSSETVE